ncbi:MAG: HAD family hydrolase, partial [Chloroflexota bacterium]
WHEGVPRLYAEQLGISFEEALSLLHQQYDEVGDQRQEWYDIHYWFQRFGLSHPERLLAEYTREVAIYPDVKDTLYRLGQTRPLIVTSSSARDFLRIMTAAIGDSFGRVFSTISDCGQLKSDAFYQMVCHQMNVSPDELAHVGDHREFDFIIPRRVGIEAFHLDRTGTATGEHVVKDLQEFEARLAKLD